MNTKRKKSGNMLALASFAVGLTEIFAGKKLDKFLGTGKGENAGIFRVLGVREVLQGVDLLSHNNKIPGVRARLAGDVLDGALLGVAAKNSNRKRNVLLAAGMVLPLVAKDLKESKFLKALRR